MATAGRKARTSLGNYNFNRVDYDLPARFAVRSVTHKYHNVKINQLIAISYS